MEANVNSSEHKLGKIGRLLTTALSDVAVPKHSSLCRKICDTWISIKKSTIQLMMNWRLRLPMEKTIFQLLNFIQRWVCLHDKRLSHSIIQYNVYIFACESIHNKS